MIDVSKAITLIEPCVPPHGGSWFLITILEP